MNELNETLQWVILLGLIILTWIIFNAIGRR